VGVIRINTSPQRPERDARNADGSHAALRPLSRKELVLKDGRYLVAYGYVTPPDKRA
jgi:hypothetical protein